MTWSGIVGCFRALPHFVDSNCIQDGSDLFCSVETWHSRLCGWRRLSGTAWKWSLIWCDPFVPYSFFPSDMRSCWSGGVCTQPCGPNSKRAATFNQTQTLRIKLPTQAHLHTSSVQLSIHSGFYLPCQISPFFRIQLVAVNSGKPRSLSNGRSRKCCGRTFCL